MSRVYIPDTVTDSPISYAFAAYAPKLTAAMDDFQYAVYEHTLLTVREMEAARIATAHINGCLVCKPAQAARDFNRALPKANARPFTRPMDTRGPAPGDDFYAAVADWRHSTLFSARERLAIEYAERMGQRPQSLEGDEEFWTRMKSRYSDHELVDLTVSIASWIAAGRVLHVLELDSAACMTGARQSEVA